MPRRRTITTTQQGYGAAHQRARRQAIDNLNHNPGQPCARCHKPMWPGQALHLDHTDDRNAYLGLSHQTCNTRAGAIKGNQRRARKQPWHSRPW